MLKKSFKILGWTLFGIFSFIALYITSVLLISKITVNSDADLIKAEKTIPVYILSNGVHTDIVVPIKNEIKDWRSQIQFNHTKSKDSLMNYIAFGWGDKGFYLYTPEWSDLKVSTACRAACGISSSAIHTTFFKQLREGEDCKRIMISKENYQNLVNYISETFSDPVHPQWIEGHSYGKKDAFYEAKGSYNLFYTCNTWANNSLKAANQKASLWTVYDKGIFCHYK